MSMKGALEKGRSEEKGDNRGARGETTDMGIEAEVGGRGRRNMGSKAMDDYYGDQRWVRNYKQRWVRQEEENEEKRREKERKRRRSKEIKDSALGEGDRKEALVGEAGEKSASVWQAQLQLDDV
eukprot:42391-Pleurochrysis_carterae.AAC.5